MDDAAPPVEPEAIRWDAVFMAGAFVAMLGGVAISGIDGGEPAPEPSERMSMADDVVLGAPLAFERAAVASPAGGGAGGEVQLCGGEWVAVDAEGKPDRDALARADVRAHRAVERITLERMLASGDPRAVASAWRHRAFRTGVPPAGQPLDRDAAAALASLVDMAIVGREPEVYAMALSACDLLPATERCALLNAAQWTALDAENASAWLRRAGDAADAGDRSAEDDALWRAARATRFDSGFATTVAHTLAHAPDDDDHVYGALSVISQATHIAVLAQIATSQRGLDRSCSPAAVGDATRRERCDEAAQALVARADTLSDRALGTRVGRRLGWPAEKLDAIDAEQKALMAAVPTVEAAQQPMACAAIRRDLDWLRQVASLGETRALARAATVRTASSGR